MTKHQAYDDLYPQVCTIDNLYQASRKARKGKRTTLCARWKCCPPA